MCQTRLSAECATKHKLNKHLFEVIDANIIKVIFGNRRLVRIINHKLIGPI